MGLLTKLLTLPVSAPLSGALWIGEKVHEAALDAYYDPAAIRAELARLEQRLLAGELSEAAYEEAEMPLLLRLKEAAARRGAAR